MSITKAVVTAENRPACKCGQRLHSDRVVEETHEDQRVVEVFIVHLHAIGVVLHRLLFVRSVEIKSGVIVLDGPEVLPEFLSDAGVSGQFVGPRNQFSSLERTSEGRHWLVPRSRHCSSLYPTAWMGGWVGEGKYSWRMG